jgi:hypothetical protein
MQAISPDFSSIRLEFELVCSRIVWNAIDATSCNASPSYRCRSQVIISFNWGLRGMACFCHVMWVSVFENGSVRKKHGTNSKFSFLFQFIFCSPWARKPLLKRMLVKKVQDLSPKSRWRFPKLGKVFPHSSSYPYAYAADMRAMNEEETDKFWKSHCAGVMTRICPVIHFLATKGSTCLTNPENGVCMLCRLLEYKPRHQRTDENAAMRRWI